MLFPHQLMWPHGKPILPVGPEFFASNNGRRALHLTVYKLSRSQLISLVLSREVKRALSAERRANPLIAPDSDVLVGFNSDR